VESGAVVTHDALPAVMGSAPLLSQVFGNLIGNSLKFRGEASPRVHISAERRGDEWVFSVADNGLGIDPDYADRIFVIFQRLHTREEYPGTGIGLAICKKAVERLGGRIWVESQPGQGTTFFFTVPVIDGPGLDAVAPDSAGEQRSGTPSGDDHPVHGVSHGDTRGSRDKPNNSDAGKLATAGL
jgi:light-regulated signal transduction histidine kinase (bacteriophytochrome)